MRYVSGDGACGGRGTAFPQKPDGHINVKLEFGEGKVPLDNIAKRAESYKHEESGNLGKFFTRSMVFDNNGKRVGKD